MQRVFGSYAYGNGPRDGCWWDETCEMPSGDPLKVEEVDVAIIGGGFTGITAALSLSQAGVRVAVFEAQAFGWGASGRNGGFCCLGGGVATDTELDGRFGKDARLEYRRAEVSAVAHVEHQITNLGLDVDRHSTGETELAHRPKDMVALRQHAAKIVENYQVEPQVLEPADLSGAGFGDSLFHGGLTVPIGFALNPRKYLSGLVQAAQAMGAHLHDFTTVNSIERAQGGWRLGIKGACIQATSVIIATNGYSSDDVPAWLHGRYMPAQSTVLVTRPLSDAEISAQGWTSGQMCYDTRNLLHYFRLMPDRRFLFGMRGALRSGTAAEAAARAKTRQHFDRMFPAWQHVETSHSWSGFVSLARYKSPFVGPVPDMPGVWTALCYHGNGVAMGSYAGRLIADQLLALSDNRVPKVMRRPLGAFPFGRFRRWLMPPLYAQLGLADLI